MSLMSILRRLISGSHVSRSAYPGAAAVACVAFATVFRFVIDPFVGSAPFITFFPAVVVAGYLGGAGAGTVAVLVGGLTAAYFWIPPLNSLALQQDQWVTVGIYVMLVTLTHRLKQSTARAELAEKTATLYANEMAHRTRNLVSLIQAVANLSFKDGESPEEQRRLFNDRLIALGHAHSLSLACHRSNRPSRSV